MVWIIETRVKQLVKSTKIYQLIDLALKIRKLVRQAQASLLPSILTSFDFDVSPAVMEEDLKEGRWGNSQLVARSKGWKFDVRRFLAQEVFKKLPAGHGLVVISRRIGEAIQSREISHKDLEQSVINALLEHAIPFEGEGVFEIEPRSFGPVNIDDENWSRLEIKGVAVTEIDHNRLEPARVGTAEIIVRARTDREKFGGVGSLTAVKPVQVKQIVMRIEPKELILEPGEPWELTLTVENSAFPREVKVEARAGEVTSKHEKGNTLSIRKTPSNR